MRDKKQLRVLTATKTLKRDSYTYNLMSNGMVHINNHVTSEKSIIVPAVHIAELLK